MIIIFKLYQLIVIAYNDKNVFNKSALKPIIITQEENNIQKSNSHQFNSIKSMVTTIKNKKQYNSVILLMLTNSKSQNSLS